MFDLTEIWNDIVTEDRPKDNLIHFNWKSSLKRLSSVNLTGAISGASTCQHIFIKLLMEIVRTIDSDWGWGNLLGDTGPINIHLNMELKTPRKALSMTVHYGWIHIPTQTTHQLGRKYRIDQLGPDWNNVISDRQIMTIGADCMWSRGSPKSLPLARVRCEP